MSSKSKNSFPFLVPFRLCRMMHALSLPYKISLLFFAALDTVNTLRMHLQCCTGRAATAACQHCQCDAIPTNGGSRLPLCCACGEGGVIPCAFRVLGRTRSLSVFSSSDKYSIQRSSSDRSLEVGLP